MSNDASQHRFRTRAVHAGERPDPTTGASAPNLVMSTSFVTEAGLPFSALSYTEDSPYLYGRWSNPTVRQLERKLASLEDAESAVAFSSGMGAATALFLHLLKSGDHLVISDLSYAGVAEFANETLVRNGVRVTKVNMSHLDEVAEALRDGAKLVFIETPCNPILRLTDIRAVAELAHEAGAELAVDSTFASPAATRPVGLGADYVIHSLTKYFCGHGDALGGAIIGRSVPLAKLRQDTAIHVGAVLSPFNAWLIMRGVATLPLRMRAHAEGAMQVARFLEEHPRVERVIYPGLPSHPQFELAQRQMDNFSGVLTFQAENSAELAQHIAKHLNVFHYAVSLGHHRSLIFYISTDDVQESSFKLDADQLADFREYAGEGIFRVSIGIEDPADLIADLGQVLA